MWTGRQTLGSIESAIGKLYRDESRLDASLRSGVAEAERLRKERAEALRELARVKLDEMAAGRLVNRLDAGERRAVQILDDYRRRMANIAERRDARVVLRHARAPDQRGLPVEVEGRGRPHAHAVGRHGRPRARGAGGLTRLRLPALFP